jgi:hypothetical protein
VTRTNTDQHPDPFSDFINHYLYLSDEAFTPIESPAPTDRRWHYGQYQADSTANIYSQPDMRYNSTYGLRPTNSYAHALLRYLPDIRPGWTAIALTLGNPIVGYVRNDSAHFRPSSGVYEYLLMLRNSALIVLGLSVLIFLYAIPQGKTHQSNRIVLSNPLEQRVERFVARLENDLFPLQ